MEKVKVYVVEDRAITRELIVVSLEKLGFHVVGQNDEAELAFDEIKSSNADIVILDIDLIGDKNGIWLAGRINKELDLPFIYLTAFGDKKTLSEVVETKPHGFLLKPFNESMIYTSIMIALEKFSSQNTSKGDIKLTLDNNDGLKLKDNLFVRKNNLLQQVRINDILYIKSDGKYLELHLPDKKYLIRSKLVDFIQQLDSTKFKQVHLRYAIRMDSISIIGGDFVVLNDIEIPVSKTYKKELLNAISAF